MKRSETEAFNNMAISPDFALKMIKLNGTNYRDWAFNMRLHFKSLGLFEHADGSAETPPDDSLEAVKKKFISSANIFSLYDG